MLKFLIKSNVWAMGVISVIFTFIPEAIFGKYKLILNASDEANIVLARVLSFAIVLIVSIIINVLLLCKTSIPINGHGYSIKVEYGDILKKDNCKKVINFDECFTTSVGDAPSDVKPSSICGQYLVKNPIYDMNSLIENAQLKPKGKSKYRSKERYESGRLVPNGDFLLMAFAKLDKDGRGWFFSREEYLDCLAILWNEIDKYYGQKDVCIPILGSGITRFEDKLLTKQELLDIIVASYKLSSYKIKPPYQLHIVCTKDDGFSLNKIGETL